ncbi:Uncharacterized protein SCF082_LOCUS49255 [Durusdinium trenchii]|uniref:Uncharacterized protein n=1 Tax=Durusdinium trenchii TaxID=1381693 RepID=A0ABP0S026_9DINO
MSRNSHCFRFWGTWHFLDYVYVIVLVVFSWLQGLIIMKQSTVLKLMVSETTLITVMCLLSLARYNFGVRMGPSLMLVMIVYMTFVLYRTAEVYEDERKFHYQAVGPKFEESDLETVEEEDYCHTPWLGCYDKKIKGAPILPAEEEEGGGSPMDMQMLVISLVLASVSTRQKWGLKDAFQLSRNQFDFPLVKAGLVLSQVYAATDTTRTLLNSYALSSALACIKYLFRGENAEFRHSLRLQTK